MPKKPTIKDTVESLRFAINHNLIIRLDKTTCSSKSKTICLIIKVKRKQVVLFNLARITINSAIVNDLKL